MSNESEKKEIKSTAEFFFIEVTAPSPADPKKLTWYWRIKQSNAHPDNNMVAHGQADDREAAIKAAMAAWKRMIGEADDV